MFYRNLSGLMLSDLPCEACAKDPQSVTRLSLASRLLLTGSVLAAPFVALFTVLVVQGLSSL